MANEKISGKEEAPGVKTLGPFQLDFNFFIAIGFILFSIIIFAIMPYQIEEPPMIMGQAQSGVTPALFPGVTLVLLFGVSVWYLLIGSRLDERNQLREVGWPGFGRVVVSALLMTAYAVSMESLGFMLSSGILIALLTSYYGNRNLVLLVLSTILTPLAVYYLFTRVLLVFLPAFSLLEDFFGEG